MMNKVGLFIIYFYRVYFSSFLGGSCQFRPSCSEYSRICFQEFNFLKALYLTLWRILRCHPFRQLSYDAVPTFRKKLNIKQINDE